MKIIYFFFFILILNNVYGFGVSPGKFNIEINNGEEIEKEFFIYNNENELKKFNISSSGFFNFTDFILEVKETIRFIQTKEEYSFSQEQNKKATIGNYLILFCFLIVFGFLLYIIIFLS